MLVGFPSSTSSHANVSARWDVSYHQSLVSLTLVVHPHLYAPENAVARYGIGDADENAVPVGERDDIVPPRVFVVHPRCALFLSCFSHAC
jgi:hypothetical protein